MVSLITIVFIYIPQIHSNEWVSSILSIWENWLVITEVLKISKIKIIY